MSQGSEKMQTDQTVARTWADKEDRAGDGDGAHTGDDKAIFRKYPPSREYLIPILQEVQDRYGNLSKENIYAIADYLELP